MITSSKQITKHFHSTEFRCKCGCGKIYIEEKLVNNMEKLFERLNASKCIISSGYRCSKHDKAVGGSGTGQHTKGYASDCIYYDKNNKIIPSKIVICVAYDLDLFRGIAKIDDNYTHLDIRTSGYYKGDETVNFNSVWTNPYTYFKVSKEDVTKYTGEAVKKKSIDEIAKEVINGKWGNGSDRKNRLTKAGYNYSEVQKRVNELVNKKSIDIIAKEVINGKWGNGTDRKNRLTKAGYDYKEIQNRVNQLLG